jgi:hypothetical protein
MPEEAALRDITREIATARYAQKLGNDGMVRVCARRAAGLAISLWLRSNPQQGWGVDAMNQLRSLYREQTMPHAVRDAALRLATKLSETTGAPATVDPLGDAEILIHHLLGTP